MWNRTQVLEFFHRTLAAEAWKEKQEVRASSFIPTAAKLLQVRYLQKIMPRKSRKCGKEH